MSNVVDLNNKTIGDGFVLDADDVLTAAIGHSLREAVVIGISVDGTFYISGTHGRDKSMMLASLAQHVLCQEAIGE